MAPFSGVHLRLDASAPAPRRPSRDDDGWNGMAPASLASDDRQAPPWLTGEIGMNSDELEGKMNGKVGALQAAAGRAVDDPVLEAEGEARQIVGGAQEAVGKAKETVTRTARRAKAAVTEAADQVEGAYETLRDTAQTVADTVDPFVKEKPYISLALAAFAGFILGALLSGGGAKVIYIRPARE
jgi:uncharacterized protein YjbJ (UPF0337 family)